MVWFPHHTIDSYVGIKPVVEYYERFRPQTFKHFVRFSRVKAMLPCCLDGTWRKHKNVVKEMKRLNDER